MQLCRGTTGHTAVMNVVGLAPQQLVKRVSQRKEGATGK